MTGPPNGVATTLWTVRRACSPIQKEQDAVRPFGIVRRTCTCRVVAAGERHDARDELEGPEVVLQDVTHGEVLDREQDASGGDRARVVAVEGRAGLRPADEGGGGGHAPNVDLGADGALIRR